MAWLTKTRVKYGLAAVGGFYAVAFAGYLVYAGVNRMQPHGPSELELHPERQAEISAQQRADEMKTRLNLTDDQTKQIADILKSNPAPDPSAGGDPREHWKGLQEKIAPVLTPDQQAQALQMRGQFGGRGGPGGRLSPERIDEIKTKMTPEQRERFEQALQRHQQRRQQGGQQGGRGFPPGNAPGRPQ